MVNFFYNILENIQLVFIRQTVHKLLFKNKYLSYEYDKYLYNLKIDIKEHSIHFIHSLIHNNKTHDDIKNIAVAELEERPKRILEQDKYLQNVINKNIIVTDIIQNISNNDPEWLLEIIDDLQNLDYSVIKPNNYSTFVHKLKWELTKNYIKKCNMLNKFILLKDMSDNDLINFTYYQINIDRLYVTNDDIRIIYKPCTIEQISNIINNIKIKDNNWKNIFIIWQKMIVLAIKNNKYNQTIYKLIYDKIDNKDIVIKCIINKLDSLKFYDALQFRLYWFEYPLIIEAIDNFIINKINNEPYWSLSKLNRRDKQIRQKRLSILKNFDDIHKLDNIPKVIRCKSGRLRFKRTKL
jgi:hypothetical protein